MTKKENYKLYALVCPLEKKVKYIGITKQDLKKRLSGHLYEKGNPGKREWILYLKKINKKPSAKILKENLSLSQAKKEEIKSIKEYRNLLNIHPGGNAPPSWSGKRHTKSTIEKIREKNKNKKVSKVTREKISRAKRGIKRSAESCRKQALSIRGSSHWNFGRKTSGSAKQKMRKKQGTRVQKILNNKIIATYDSINQAAQENNIKYPETISRCCRGLYRHAAGYQWKFYEH